ncbi:MAG: alcohol dehydrogenase catalytic domain-containing protein [Candidatus Thermoplasmatota archaeon]|nr:alcohol dehydrogenase catalytic domain-containing protein [Candidatus Thermoplasmatota archaeon]MBU1940193.1 alcohol dehydrogenase catalytic domain-containing protein [Candidatus Thermoplasmatota archaeon]
MKVAMYYTNHDVRIEEQPIPTIKDDELLVKVKASGICGSDVMEWYRIKKAPCVLGHEITGDILQVGNKIKHYRVGDRVFVSHHVPCNTCQYCLNDQHTLCTTLHTTNFDPGGFAEYLRVPPINVDRGTFQLPDTVTYHEGVFIEPLACVIRGLRIARFTPGQSVAVLGSGMSGLLHVMLAYRWGASTIFSTDIVDFRLQKAKTFGAKATIKATENIPEQIRKHNNGHLADLVVVCTSASAAMSQAIHVVERGGTILFFAPPEPDINIPIPLFELWNKGITVVSTYAGSPKDIVHAIALLQQKQLPVTDLITHVLPITKAAKGFQLAAAAQDSIKVILEP